jgi:hypothetical protein
MKKEIEPLHIFVDEYGTNSLNTTGATTPNLFIMVAIYVKDSDLINIGNALNNLSNQLCNGSEIRSNRIGSNHTRRKRFLNQICEFDFKYRALIVNKKSIDKKSGLKFKKTFYKFVAKIFYTETSNAGIPVSIYADEIGSKEYMGSFESYFETQGLPDLFTRYSFCFIDSKENRLIQLADFIAGTLGYCFDETKKSNGSVNYRNLLKQKEINIQTWPLIKSTSSAREEFYDNDQYIQALLTNRAIEFIKSYSKNESSALEKCQALVVESLLFSRYFEDAGLNDIYADELIRKIQNEGYFSLTKQQLASQIIGPIRDYGIILVGSHRGYRLAFSINDICEYLDHDARIIEPMLSRISRAKASLNGENIFVDSTHLGLKNLVETYEQNRIDSQIYNPEDSV